MVTKEIVDLFCGGGGTSTGVMEACRDLGYGVNLTAINHWDIAIKTHSMNHVTARHLCESLDNVDPRKLYPERHIYLLVASPECTHHSVARGGRPINDQSRASAWQIVRWAEALHIENIIIENVPEFQKWGPIDPETNKLVPALKGQTYQAFLNALRSLGYNVEDRILCAADYGEATTRKRLFVIARKGKSVVWPKQTHCAPDERKKGLKLWRTARSIIDWSLPSKSIFGRKKPLAHNTVRRIAIGFNKLCDVGIEPFLVMFYGTGTGRSTKRPLPTVTANGSHIALAEPQVVGVDTGKGAVPVWESHLIKYYGSGIAVSPDKPLDTVTTKDRFGLAQGLIGRDKNGLRYLIDVRLRMLQPHELAAAQGFPKKYVFAGTRAVKIKQIGNAVPVHMAKALALAVLNN